MSMRTRRLAVPAAAAAFALSLCGTLRAATVTYVGKIDGAPASSTTTYSAGPGGGYDLYSTDAVSPTNGSFSGAPFGAGARLTSLPGYVASVTANGANASFAGYYNTQIENPQSGAAVEAGQVAARGTTPATERTVLNINLGGTSAAPATFYVLVLTDINNSGGDTPDAYRLAGGGGDSGLQSTAKTVNPGNRDYSVFQVSGAAANDVLTLSGTQSNFNAGSNTSYDVTVAGLLFSTTNPVPEPTAATAALAGLGLLASRRRRRRRA